MPRVRVAVLGALLRLPRLFIRAGDVVFRVGYVLFASLRGSLGQAMRRCTRAVAFQNAPTALDRRWKMILGFEAERGTAAVTFGGSGGGPPSTTTSAVIAVVWMLEKAELEFVQLAFVALLVKLAAALSRALSTSVGVASERLSLAAVALAASTVIVYSTLTPPESRRRPLATSSAKPRRLSAATAIAAAISTARRRRAAVISTSTLSADTPASAASATTKTSLYSSATSRLIPSTLSWPLT